MYCSNLFLLTVSDDVQRHVELSADDSVRARTRGNSPFVETITRLDVAASAAAAVCNYSGGEPVGASWTDRIMAVKKSAGDGDKTRVPREDEGAGAADDEWDD